MWSRPFSPNATLSPKFLILLLLAAAHVLLVSGKHTQQVALSPPSHTHPLHKDCPAPYSHLQLCRHFSDSSNDPPVVYFKRHINIFVHRCVDVQMYADVSHYIIKVKRCLKWQAPDVCGLVAFMWPAELFALRETLQSISLYHALFLPLPSLFLLFFSLLCV